jgi:thiol-disulfide isomerase/thioredoxin
LDFNLPSLSGAGYSSSDKEFAGKVLLVTLWGTWCPPCVSEIPALNSIQARFGDDGFAVVAIAFESDLDATVRQGKLSEFVEEHQIGYLVLDGGATESFSSALPMVEGVSGFPVEILIDRNGRVVDCRNGYGYSEEWARELDDRITGLLNADR